MQTGYKSTFQVPAASVLARCRRVKLTAGVAVYAGATDNDIGTLVAGSIDTVAKVVSVTPPTFDGALDMVAAGAITQYAAVYAAADGKVAATGTVYIGWALDAATADGDLVKVVRDNNPRTAATCAITVPLTDARVTATGALLGTTAGTPSGAFGLTVGTHGSASPILVGEAASGNSKTDKCRVLAALPPEYVAGQAVTLRVHARITGDVEVAQTIDATVYEGDTEAGISADLCTTDAITLTDEFADCDFTITPTDLAPGDLLDVELTGLANDTGGSANKLIQIGSIAIRAGLLN